MTTRPPDDHPPRVLRVGGLASDPLRRALAARDIALNEAAERLLGDPRLALSTHPRALSVCVLTPRNLGLTDGAPFDAITAAALAHGAALAPLELGPHLRLQWTEPRDAPAGPPGRAPPGALTVASAPLDDDDDTPKGFYLRRVDGRLWLRGYRSWPGHPWSADDRFVFLDAHAAESDPPSDVSGP